jgi:hypothetical protein
VESDRMGEIWMKHSYVAAALGARITTDGAYEHSHY